MFKTHSLGRRHAVLAFTVHTPHGYLPRGLLPWCPHYTLSRSLGLLPWCPHCYCLTLVTGVHSAADHGLLPWVSTLLLPRGLLPWCLPLPLPLPAVTCIFVTPVGLPMPSNTRDDVPRDGLRYPTTRVHT